MVQFYAKKSMFYSASSTAFKKAEELRLNMTVAELHLWEHLRKNQVLKQIGNVLKAIEETCTNRLQ